MLNVAMPGLTESIIIIVVLEVVAWILFRVLR